MSYYDVLGVPRDASEGQIKKAYRKAAGKAHPDKGGSDSDMAQINRAYEVLVNPEKRKIYDATGHDDTQVNSVEHLARGLAMQAFAHILQNNIEHECMRHVRGFIDAKIQHASGQKAAIEEEKKKLVRRRDKIKTKGEVNLFHMLIDQKLQHCEQILVNTDGELAVARMALEMVKGYESIEEAVQQVQWHPQQGLAQYVWTR